MTLEPVVDITPCKMFFSVLFSELGASLHSFNHVFPVTLRSA